MSKATTTLHRVERDSDGVSEHRVYGDSTIGCTQWLARRGIITSVVKMSADEQLITLLRDGNVEEYAQRYHG